jgi:hypothetical protein
MPLSPGTPDVLASPAIPGVLQNALGAGSAITYSIVAVNFAGQDTVPGPAFITANDNAATPNNTITWFEVPGAAGYRVLKNGALLASVGAGVTSYTDNAGSAGVSYTAATSNPPAYVPAAHSPIDGGKNTYRASVTALASAASATDIFTLTGSASKTIRVTRLEISGQQTTAAAAQVVVLVRSTADTGGTHSAPTIVPFDSNSPAASATVLSYTANPTVGNLVGNLFAGYVFLAAPATATVGSDKVILDYGNRPSQAIVLRGTSQVLAVNLNGATVTGGAFDINIEWTEE